MQPLRIVILATATATAVGIEVRVRRSERVMVSGGLCEVPCLACVYSTASGGGCRSPKPDCSQTEIITLCWPE
jgi:hypothetical protein